MNLFKIAIIILNYNNAVDTIACLESILKNEYDTNNFKLIVVDNASTDNSIEKIVNYLSICSYTSEVLENKTTEFEIGYSLRDITLLKSSINGGYAKGNNLGIQLAMIDSDVQQLWVLNNDTEVEKDCLKKTLLYCREHSLEKLILGTLLVRYYNRNAIQLLGGNYYPLFGKGGAVYPEFPVNKLSPAIIEEAEKKMDYIVGASILFSRKFIQEVGAFNEDYFLYLEEIDIIKRSKKFGYKLKLIPDAIVYHKEGGATNTNYNKKKERSLFIEYHNCRSKLIFTKTHYPFFYPITAGAIFVNLLLFYKFNPKKVVPILKFFINNK